jgi:hypothetical protein
MHRIFKKKRIWDFFSYYIYSRFQVIIGNSISVVNSLKQFVNEKKIYLINNGVKFNKNLKFKKKIHVTLLLYLGLKKEKIFPSC